MTTTTREKCWRVRRMPDGTVTAGVEPLGWSASAAGDDGDVVVRVEAAGSTTKTPSAPPGIPA
jgi:hypothetical protein